MAVYMNPVAVWWPVQGVAASHPVAAEMDSSLENGSMELDARLGSSSFPHHRKEEEVYGCSGGGDAEGCC